MIDLSVSLTAERGIRRQLATGMLAPGAWVREATLATALGVSRTPVREACSRISRDGLLEWIPNRGYRIPLLSPEELNDVYPVLIAIEAVALASLPKDATALVEELRGEGLRLALAAGDTGELFGRDRRWHGLVVQATGNPVLIDIHTRLVDRLERYLVSYWGRRRDVAESDREHDQIVDAIAAGDRDLAAALARLHRVRGLARIVRLMQGAPPPEHPKEERA